MSNTEDTRPGIALTNRYLLRRGVPVVPVSGEIHYSRLPRDRWQRRLRQLRAGGVTVASTYVFWLHHVEHRGRPRFDDNLDVAAFVDLATTEGLDIILRIGPWCHAETRNGGFPDWVQRTPARHRTDDPAYLDLVREWYGQLGAALDGRCGPDGPVLGIQLENELYDQPDHLITLKRLAREAGMSAPLWTATAWGSAALPQHEVLPLYGGYGDGFWVDADAPWDPTFRDHYFFSHVWDDPGIGSDVRRLHADNAHATRPRSPSTHFPPATCELGGGMATAYHRRPRPRALDIAAIAHCKIGNGSAWQGYYMYAGGTNPHGEHGMQESHATGYPNDLPPLGYDFHAPIGEAGVPAGSHAVLRRQHAFLAAFGASLAEMPSSLPAIRPSGVDDAHTLRYALRSDGTSGFLFVAWHQPHLPLASHRDAQFRVVLDHEEIVMPARPIDIPPGTLARWPLALKAGGVRLDWSTASALTLLPGDVPTLVLVAEPGIEATYSVDGVVTTATPCLSPVRLRTAAGGALDLLILPATMGDEIWVCEDGPTRRLLRCPHELCWGPDGRIEAYGPQARVYEPAQRAFVDLPLEGGLPSTATPVAPHPAGTAGPAQPVTPELVRPAATPVPAGYGTFQRRQSAPTPQTFDDLAAVYRIPLPRWAADPRLDAILRIRWAGDVGQLRVDGRPVTDRFWDGAEWLVNLPDIGLRADAELTLHLLPLAVDSPVSLPRDARDRLAAVDGQLSAVDALLVQGRGIWREPAPLPAAAHLVGHPMVS
ncbi:beta-galactosidase [Micromonospora craniellae]|uniref:Beta-galactosidase n=2 Tax=Micromonospora craniellae TaxID=2294034 RepID=A0A372FRV1_9ACTN|nr:beta-galactosidase [Micromonospora craniellae]RFS43239.1 beta-galactosidase [Micromonospora craniellae]